MNIEISVLKRGGIMLVSDRPLPYIIDHVEYYTDQKLMMLVYADNKYEDHLMDCEIADDMVNAVYQSPEAVIFTLFADHDPVGYKVPLVNVGS